MKITAHEEYGLRCLLRLARAADGSLTLPEIAEAEALSVSHVAKVMAVLRQAGLVESVRGRAGGYRLARPAEQIRLGALLLTLGEPLFDEADYCHKHAGIAPGGVCVNQASCTLKSLWLTLEQWMRGTLDRITIADLLRHEGEIVELLRERLAAALGDEATRIIPLTVVNG
jgi:Rrf2 family transcriptional regulator, iron-sulfur cluster assembly transcription factor